MDCSSSRGKSPETAEYLPKAESYEVVLQNEKEVFRCNICQKLLSRKQRILTHLNTVHGKSPLKKVYKRYQSDPSLPTPKRTAFRHKSNLKTFNEDSAQSSSCQQLEDSETESNRDSNNTEHEPRLTVETLFNDDSNLQSSEENVLMDSHDSDPNDICESIFKTLDVPITLDNDTVSLEENSSDFSDIESSSSSCSDTTNLSDDQSDCTSTDTESGDLHEANIKVFTEQEKSQLCVIAYLLKYNVGGSQANSLIELISLICPGSENLKKLDIATILSFDDETNTKSKHYCSVCTGLFPEDEDVFMCSNQGCNNYRYVGPLSNQLKPGRQPRNSFLMVDVRRQLKCLLEKKGIWTEITKSKIQASTNTNGTLTDIVHGQSYQSHCSEGNFLASENNISFIFNTDGIPLYNSSKVKLWPIFLAINELPAAQRFSRENMLLAGIWQGKGNPPFDLYMFSFGEEMCSLKDFGVDIKLSPNAAPFTVKGMLLLGTMDLQAKAYVLNMTMHNGSNGCCTCEEEGMSVQQGKGYSRCYPYRTEQATIRDSDDVKYEKGPTSSKKHRKKGICGPSGLSSMPWFNVVSGIVPDYMHGVLMGVTKTLLYKWLSPTNSKRPFYVGDKINLISKRLQKICPPDYIERLPRNLETNYAHLKATELQAWLLFYAIPCLNGILDSKYLEHFSLLSEGIHILLGDSIRSTDLDRSESMLSLFYEQFAELYGQGSCGLNVHNIGQHLVFYVKQWGPIWGWSCFPFEDMNADILKSVHGTGDVTHQYLKIKELKIKLASINPETVGEDAVSRFLHRMKSTTKRAWTNVKKLSNCYIAGKPSDLRDISPATEETILTRTGVDKLKQLEKVTRVSLFNGEKLYSRQYTRMSKRICHVVRSETGGLYDIHFFILRRDTNYVYFVAEVLEVKNNCFLHEKSGHHIISVTRSSTVAVLPVQVIAEKVFFMAIENDLYIAMMPNILGHKQIETSKKIADNLQKLDEWRLKSNTLLYSMMPESIAVRLKNGEDAIKTCETFEQVTIMFSYLIGFSEICAHATAFQVVECINSVFTVFDAIVDRYKVFKVETLGDAVYMVAGGVPDRRADHSQRVAGLALEFVDNAKFLKDPLSGNSLKVRIGMHVGGVVAGIVGKRTPQYCLFGDTVNTASRMQSYSQPGRIHISQSCHENLQGSKFITIYRGRVNVKGKGEQKTYWLAGRRGEASTVRMTNLIRAEQIRHKNTSNGSIESSFDLHGLHMSTSGTNFATNFSVLSDSEEDLDSVFNDDLITKADRSKSPLNLSKIRFIDDDEDEEPRVNGSGSSQPRTPEHLHSPPLQFTPSVLHSDVFQTPKKTAYSPPSPPQSNSGQSPSPTRSNSGQSPSPHRSIFELGHQPMNNLMCPFARGLALNLLEQKSNKTSPKSPVLPVPETDETLTRSLDKEHSLGKPNGIPKVSVTDSDVEQASYERRNQACENPEKQNCISKTNSESQSNVCFPSKTEEAPMVLNSSNPRTDISDVKNASDLGPLCVSHKSIDSQTTLKSKPVSGPKTSHHQSAISKGDIPDTNRNIIYSNDDGICLHVPERTHQCSCETLGACNCPSPPVTPESDIQRSEIT